MSTFVSMIIVLFRNPLVEITKTTRRSKPYIVQADRICLLVWRLGEKWIRRPRKFCAII